jgi:prepilin-type N-terminal cleavage/methylation domain-containing protein
MQGGYTLVEVMASVLILSLLMAGVMGMFIAMLRIGGSVTGSVNASLDARNAIQRITSDFREARRFSLQDNATYDATDAGNNVVAVTAVQMTFPAARPTVSVAKDVGGNQQVALPGPSAGALWDRSDGSALLFFRANWKQPEGVDGTPNPNTGKCLWVRGVENGAAVDGPLVKSIAPTLNAVQFIQPYVPGSNPPITIPNEVKIKLTTASYDPVHGTASSDSAGGGVTQLTGDCVFLRDHDPSGVTSLGVNGQAQN